METFQQQYSGQDRGNSDRYKKYLSGMDSIIVEKVASASAFFTDTPGHTIVDIGMASGTSSYILAVLFPNTQIIGIDINPKMIELAKARYQLPNLSFVADDGETLKSLEGKNIIGFFSCSSIHHITSFNQYNPQKAFNSIKRQADLLAPGGIMVIRDFVKPESEEVILEFPDNEQGHSNSELLLEFAKTARALSPEFEKGFPINRLAPLKFRLNLVDATEFIRRKDYLNDWEVELQEEYGYYSQNEFESIYSALGLRTIISSPIYNPWIVSNRYKNKFRLFSLDGSSMPFPPTNYLIAGEKVESNGTLLNTIRELPIPQNSFLTVSSYQDEQSNQIYQIAQRPQPVVDLLPYFVDPNGNLRILAKHGYPRPIVNQLKLTETLDNKKYSGYLTESITAMKSVEGVRQQITHTLLTRALLASDDINNIEGSLRFYTSPGGIDEMVDSYFVELNSQKTFVNVKIDKSYSGFDESGEVRLYEANQLLKSIQVGAVPDVRLELNLYNLFINLNMGFGKWLNDKVDIPTVDELLISKFEEINTVQNTVTFEKTESHSSFLQHHRSKFYEFGVENSSSILEWVVPESFSSNTVVTLPVTKYKEEVYVGIEKRNLPVPFLQEGSSLLLAAPAKRLPKTITNLFELENSILKMPVEGHTIKKTYQLGHKYLPCTGATPEQVYPYIVIVEKPLGSLAWVSLNDLLKNRNNLRDGHLLIAMFRLLHAINAD